MVTRIAQIAAGIAIVAFWLHSMNEALHLEQEVTPQDIRHGRASYEVLLAHAESDPEQYLGIYQGSRRVGYAYTRVSRLDGSHFLIRNETRLLPDLMISIPAHAESSIRIGPPDFLIEQFTSDVRMADGLIRVRVEGKAAGENDMVVTIRSSLGGAPRTVSVSRQLTLFNGLSPFVGAPRLEVGEKWLIQGIDFSMLGAGLDLTLLKPKLLQAEVLRWETIAWEGHPVPVLVAAIQEDPNDLLKRRSQAWIAEDGRILMEEHRVLGFTFRFKREPVPTKPGWRPFR